MTEPGAGSDLAGMKTRAERPGRPFRPQRRQDLHLQRHQRRPLRGGRPHRPGAPAGPVPGGAGHAGLRPGPQPEEDGPELPGHGGAVLRERAGAEGQRARRPGAGLLLPDGVPGGGAAHLRRPVRGGEPGGLRHHAGLHPGAAHLRPGRGGLPGQPLQDGGHAHRRSTSPRCSSITA